MRAIAWVLVLLLAAPAAALPLGVPTTTTSAPAAPAPAPSDLAPASGPLGLPTELVFNQSKQLADDVLQTNTSKEDVRLALALEFRKLDLDLVGLLFGGGTFEAQASIDLRVEFRALSVERIGPIVESRTGGQVNVSGLQDSTVVTADQMRTLLAGELLRAFEDEQEILMRQFVEDAFPDLTVLQAEFEWTNTSPLVNEPRDRAQINPESIDPRRPDEVRPMDPMEPPLTLDAKVGLQFVKVESLLGILDHIRSRQDRLARDPSLERAEEAEDAELERLRAQNEGAFFERSAFGTLGITQLLKLEMPPGWDLEVTMTLPKGYTFEYASADVDVDRATYTTANAHALGRLSDDTVTNPVAVSLSNRYLVTVALLATVLAAGFLLRLPVLVVSTAVVTRAAKRRLERTRSRRDALAEDLAMRSGGTGTWEPSRQVPVQSPTAFQNDDDFEPVAPEDAAPDATKRTR